MNWFDYYLIIVNLIGFILYLINMWLYNHTANGQIDKFLTIFSLAGASAGIVLAILIFDRKPVKENMMSRVFVACVFVIQFIIILLIKGIYADTIATTISQILSNYSVFLIYLGLINIVTFIAFAIDKKNAVEHRKRIRIITLLGLAFIGGTVGGLLAMYLFRHKINKDYFTIGIPLIIIMHIVLAVYTLISSS